MKLLEAIKQWLGLSRPPTPYISALRQAIDAGKRAKLAEDYPTALQHLDAAVKLTHMDDKNALVLVALHRADVYIRQGRWDEAEALLEQIRTAAQANAQTPPLSYTLSALGTLAQVRGDWVGARAYYEQALKIARDTHANGAEGRALGHLAQTYLQEGNASYAAYLLRESLPRLNVSGDIELSSTFVGLLGDALIASGQTQEGEQLLVRALRLADHMQHHAQQRLLRTRLGACAQRAGRVEEALGYYQQALQLYAPLPPSADYVRVLCSASDTAITLNKAELALEYAQAAHTLSAPLNQPATHAASEAALGTALRAGGKHEDALAHLKAAVDLYNGSTEKPVEMLHALRMLAAAQVQLESHDAPQTYRRAVQLAQRMNRPIEQAHALRDLGLMYSERGDNQAALQEWAVALQLYESEKQHAYSARLRCDIGNARRALGQGQRALKDYEHALMSLSAVNDLETRGVVLSNAAIAYAEQGDVESADDFFAETINIAHRLGDLRAEATRRGNHGWFMIITGRARRATGALEQALRLSRQAGSHLQEAVQTDNLGLAHSELGEYEVARHYHEQALELIAPLHQPRWEALFKTHYAHVLLALGEADRVMPLLDAALAFEHSTNDTDVFIRALLVQARLLLRVRGDAASAGEALNEAVVLARRADQRHLLAEALAASSEQHAAAGQHARAAALWREAQRVYAILHNPQAKVQPAWLTTEMSGSQ